MREYVRLAETLSFTKTAKEFYISQPTLSRHIVALEQELGASLLIRSTHKVELTDAGKNVYQHLKAFVDDYDEMRAELADGRAGVTGHFTLGFLYYGGMSYMREGLEAFIEQFPNVEITFLSQQPYQIYESLLNGTIDVGLAAYAAERQEGRLSGPVWEFIPVHDSKLYVFCRSDDPLAARGMVDFGDLEGRDLILTEVDDWFNDGVLLLVEEAGIHMQPVKACNQIDLFQQAVKKTGGVLIGTGHLPCNPEDHIAMIPLRHKPGISTIGLYARYGDRKPCVENFLRQFRKGEDEATMPQTT